MLAGEPFLPYTDQLVDERTLCTGAVYRFNSLSNAAVQIAPSERERQFEYIIAARWIYSRPGERRVLGHLGGGINVAIPFHCDYGYNISIGDNVVIGPSSQLLDSGRIAIGRNTTIGARVTISTLKAPSDTKTVKGSKGTEIAREVYIGENVYIGDGCIIEAGVRIGNNAIVRAGSVVVRVSSTSLPQSKIQGLIFVRIYQQTALPLAIQLKYDKSIGKTRDCEGSTCHRLLHQ